MKRPATIDALEPDFFIALSEVGLISLTGPQSDTFLQGQLTIDMPALSASKARRAAHCDFKGKAWSLPLVFRFQDSVALTLNKSSLAMTLAQLNKYGVFSKTDIIDASTKYQQFIVSGEKTKRWISDVFDSVPGDSLDYVGSESGVVIKTDVGRDTFHLVISNDLVTKLEAFLQENAVVHYEAALYEALSIAAGIPDVAGDHINEFVPQMMNVQALDAIDFGKGCYMGQEVIARTRYLGKNKRAAFIFRVPESITADPNAVLEKKLGDNWRRGGAIIRSATLAEETWLMGVLNNDTSAEDIFRVKDAQGTEFSCAALPYSIEQETNNVRGRS